MSNIYFNTLLNIKLSHEFHTDGLCNELNIIPTDSTKKLLNRFGLLFKKTNSGAILLYESTDGSPNMKIPIENDLKFTFQFSVVNSSFITFTDLDFSNQILTLYYFNNLQPTISGNEHTLVDSKLPAPIKLVSQRLRLVKADATVNYALLKNSKNESTRYFFNSDFDERTIDLTDFPFGKYTIDQFDQAHNKLGNTFTFFYSKEINAPKLFGTCELFIDKNYDLANPISFLFNFKSRPTIWRYKILTKPSSPPLTAADVNAATLAVKHEPENPADEILFKSASGTDPVIILSKDKVKLKEKGYDKIRLKKNSETLISSLPNANLTKLEKDGSDWLSDIYVYVYV